MSILRDVVSCYEEREVIKGEPTLVDSPLFCTELQVLLVGLDHFLDHLAADAAGLTGSQVAVIAFLQVDTDFP